MRNVSLRIAVAAATLAAAAPATATNGMRMIGFGPVQNSMGGASVAAPLDATTIVTNPAGLSALAPRVDVGGTAFVPTVKQESAWNLGPFGSGGGTQESDRPVDLIPTLAGVYRVQGDLTVGLAALGTAGMGVSYAGGDAGSVYGGRTYTNYMNMRIAPAAAYRVSDALSVGVAANVQYAMMSWEAAGPAHERTGAFGIGGTIGASYKVVDQLTVAAAYESKSFFQNFEFDVPAHPTLMGPVPGGTDELDFDQPQVATIGVATRPVQGLLVAVDAQWINWSGTNGKDLPRFRNDTSLTGSQPWNLDWSDQWVFKIGAQYELAAVKGLAVRAGYNYGASPLNPDRAFENIAFPAIAEHHFSLGAGYDVGTLTVNVGAQYSPEATLKGANASQFIGAYEVRMSQLVFDLGMAYRF
jgi:long-chain fatty acid transport protein